VSDQDFFFDEDEKPIEAAEEKPTRVQGQKKPATRQATAPAGIQSVTMTVAALIGVVALLIGVIIGILIPAGASTSATIPTAGTGSAVSAPQLTPEQLEGGELPAGHPDLGAGAGTGAPVPDAGSTDATAPAE